jgi:heme-degrading monooxygenase HmoA
VGRAVTAVAAEPAFTGDVAGRPVAVAHAVAAGPGLAPWIEESSGPFAVSLIACPGFLGLRLAEVLPRRPECLYVLLTAWQDLAWFRAWRAGSAFAAALAEVRADPRWGQLAQARFDFPFGLLHADRILERLEGPLLARLAARYGFPAEGACLRLALVMPPLPAPALR